ncbi:MULTISPECIES: hypothetical protein [unclassified Microbacterium]|nr:MULTISPECIES: hypothetical protein [unclassified Microbacterium]
MNNPDFIDPLIGVPLAALLTLTWWLIERHHSRNSSTTPTEGA